MLTTVLSVKELNGGINIGAKQEPLTMDTKFRRSSSYDNYYKQSQGRPNLRVLEMSPVQQIIVEETGGAVKASGVVYTDYASGQTLNATANKEVILSAGAFKTPQILMLSVCCSVTSRLCFRCLQDSRESAQLRRLPRLGFNKSLPMKTLARSEC